MQISKRVTASFCAVVVCGAALAQSPNQMTQDQLTQLTQNGRTLQLGGPDEGYRGELRLNRDGTGKGSATTDGGQTLTLTGRWTIRDGQFCRQWQEFDGGAEVCETWILRTPTSVEVYKGKDKIGANSW